MDIENLQKEKGHLIDSLINDAFKGDIPNLNDAILYHMGTGGKKLRPLLAIITYETLGGKDDAILPFAASCEVLHNWFLVHDDIEDGDKVRRNQPAIWVKYGLAHGINIGDYMAHKVFELILKSSERNVDEKRILKLVNAMTQTCLRTAEGQAMDINMRMDENPSEKKYLDMIQGKTGHYLTVPMVGAAIMANREDIVPKLIEFGRAAGAAFQIADDILDLTEGKGRNEIGRDIKEGKRSIMVVHCLKQCAPQEKEWLISILNKPPDDTTSDDVLKAKALLEKYGSVDYAKNRAQEFVNEAKKVADGLPPKLRDILYFFADYMISRRK